MSKKSKNFEEEYKNYYIKKVDDLKKKYPNITDKKRRTGKAIKNICFFIWSYAEKENDKTIDLLLKASVLLSAQDDFYDSFKISYKQKEEFYSVCESIIKEKKYKINNQSRQFIELVCLWKEVIKEITNIPLHLYRYWQERALELNKAMITEDHIFRKNDITFNKYIEISVNSFGIMFIWAAYLTKKSISNAILKKINPTLILGAKIARLSNDIASYRRKKNRVNAVNIVKKRSPKKYILSLIKKGQNEFHKKLLNLKAEKQVKKTIKNSVDFLVEFYQKSDFD